MDDAWTALTMALMATLMGVMVWWTWTLWDGGYLVLDPGEAAHLVLAAQ